MIWKRCYTLNGKFEEERDEEWIDERGNIFPMQIKYGKSTNIFQHTQPNLEDFNNHLKRVRSLSKDLLGDEKNLEAVENCALCGHPSKYSIPENEIHGLVYSVCPKCDLRYLTKRLSSDALDKFYKEDEVLSAIITNKELTKKRVKEIVIPKAKWMIKTFETIYGRKPRKVIDVGAGGGHFVFALQQLGINAIGIEPNKPSQDFCRDQFGIELDPSDFLEFCKKESDADVISFIGLLEHLPEYMPFLHGAYNMLKGKEGLVISETPRRSLSSFIQTKFPNDVVRHMTPLTHIRIFTDSSLASSYTKAGFVPKAVWYFGMDSLVLTLQLARLLDEDSIISKAGTFMLDMQKILDQGMLSDLSLFCAATSEIT